MKQRELRFGFRYPIELDVDLYHQGERLGYFKTKDIGPLGLFIETGPLGYVQQELVQIALYADGIYIAKGIIVHHSVNGVGIRFAEVSPSLFQALDKLLSIQDFSIARAKCFNPIEPDALAARSLSRSADRWQKLVQ